MYNKAVNYRILNDKEHDLLYNHYEIAKAIQRLEKLKIQRVNIEKEIEDIRKAIEEEER